MAGQSDAGCDASRHDRPAVTVDVVVFGMFGCLDTADDGEDANGTAPADRPELRVLLIQRRNPPFQGCWAIPGGFVGMRESLDEAARRELEEETGLRDVYLEQLYTFGAPERDPRTRVISVAYYALLPGHNHEVRAADDAREAAWFPVTALPPNLAFDHAHILDVALRRLRAKADYAGIAREFLPERFTLRQLRRICETVLGRQLDRANFTRRMLGVGDIEETGEIDRGGAHRPAKLYRYRRDPANDTRDLARQEAVEQSPASTAYRLPPTAWRKEAHMPATTPDAEEFVRSCAPFLRYLADRAGARRPASLREIVASAGGPGSVALVAVDVVNGFCKEGALASARVGAIVPPIVDLLTRAHAAGVPHVALVCDTHSPQAEEFHQFAPHCIAGTDEAEPVDELKALPFYDTFYLVRKNSISLWYSQADLAGWLRARQRAGLSAILAVGDCTDLCLHQLALPLKLAANQEDRPLRVVVPVDCVQTYDLPVEVAAGLGALPHHGDLLHEIFLYHLALNGVEVVSRIDE